MNSHTHLYQPILRAYERAEARLRMIPIRHPSVRDEALALMYLSRAEVKTVWRLLARDAARTRTQIGRDEVMRRRWARWAQRADETVVSVQTHKVATTFEVAT